MYNLFTTPVVVDDTQLAVNELHPALRYPYKKLLESCNAALKFRHYSDRRVASTHPLSRFLFVLSTSISSDVENYVDVAALRADRITRALNFTALTSLGDWQHLLYGGDVVEAVLVETDYPTDLTGWIAQWRDLQPITVVDHPYTSLSLDALIGDDRGNVRGTATLRINAPMLALQYYQWVRNNWIIYGDDYHAPLEVFLYQYPLANALISHLDIVIRNRYFALLNDGTLEEDNDTRDIPGFIGDYHLPIDRGLRVLTTRSNQKTETWEALLTNLTLPSGLSIYARLALPSWPAIQQVSWALAVSRLETLVQLRQYSRRRKSTRNTADDIRADQAFRRVRSTRTYIRIDPDWGEWVLSRYDHSRKPQ